MKTNSVLLKTLLLSTSQINIYKYTKDKKKKKRVIANYVGLVCLYAMLIGYSVAMCLGYGAYGLTDSIPVMNGIVISLLAFLFTFFKTNGYLFNFKEYDMLMSLPFEASTVAASKFLYMYIKSLPWYMSIAIATLIGYSVYAHPIVIVYPLWVALSLILPVIPMLASAFLGFLIARFSAGFKKNNIVQTILTFIFVIFCFSIRFIVEDIFMADKVGSTLETISEATGRTASVYLPIGWFVGAVTKCRISDILLLIGVSLVLFAGVFYVVGRSYRNINSALKSHAAARNYKMTAQKKRSVVGAIAFKEFKRLTGSTTYMVNGAMGEILAALLGIVTLIFGFDKIMRVVVHDAHIDSAIIQPAIPFIIYFCVGMVATTVCSPSLEGKNYWIVQSLPISKKTLYQGKMLFNMYLSVPFMLFGILCMGISTGAPIPELILYLILGVVLCGFSTAWGCVCGIKHMRLDWENEVEVIKQGSGVAIYMLPNMFVVMGLIVLNVVIGMYIPHILLTLIFIVIAGVLAGLSYLRVMKLAERT